MNSGPCATRTQPGAVTTLRRSFRDIRATQQASGREYVRLPARRVRSDAEDRATP